MPIPLPEALTEFVEGGMSILVGTRDAALRPEASRGVGASVSPDRSRLTVYLNVAVADRTLANIDENGEIAVTFSRVVDHRTFQVKGKVLGVRRSGKKDRGIQEQWLAAFVEQLYLAGLPRSISRRLRFWPSVAVEFEIHDVFAQTPGPGAGRKLEVAG
ncbi:MAG TPA: hypothetical protein VKY73_10660 [Polyangiaceae bacterium]|nr:hypothetical protein [Polyangiaceae bacterium]